MKTVTTDVCVIAAGPAGLAAAISAAEGGADVVLLEKAQTTGGAGNMGMGPLAIGSRLSKKRMVNLSVEKAFNIFMNYTHWMVDARLVRAYLAKSGDTIAWLEEMGVEFYDVLKYFPSSEATWHVVKPENGEPGPRAAATMYKKMTERALELGVDLRLETPAHKLVMEDGRVAGVLAKGPDGEEIEVRCKAAVVATGGCGDNPEMIKQHTGFDWGKDLFSFRIPGIVGDGIKMAWEAGAASTEISIEMTYSLPILHNEISGDMAFRQPKVMVVNQLGERFLNEEMLENVTFTGNAIRRQPGGCAYSIVGSNVMKYYTRNDLDLESSTGHNPEMRGHDEEIRRLIDAGEPNLFVADSLEELAEKMGIDPDALVESVEEYNDGCDDKDDLFFKSKEHLRPVKGPVYFGGRFFPSGYGTLGGIKINHKTEVVDAQSHAIPGLYAAGTDSCNIFVDSYVFVLPGNTMGYALNSGRMAGENAAEFVEE